MIQKELKKIIWGGLGLPLGGVWDGVGPLGGALGSSWGALGVLLKCFWHFLRPRWAPRSLFGGFLVVLGRLGGGLGKLWGAISKDLGLNAGKGWEELGTIGDSWAKSWGKLRQAKKNMADHTFVHSCAFRSPARSGLIASYFCSCGSQPRKVIFFGRIASISMIFGPNESSRRDLFLEQFSKERNERKYFD